MDKVVNEIRYQFVICVRLDDVETPLPNSTVPNWLRCQGLKTFCDFIPSCVVHADDTRGDRHIKLVQQN
jgi:hypothetical protein